MKNIIYIIAAILFSSQVISAGELSIKPEMPETGSKLILEYTGDQYFENAKGVYGFVYIFSENDAMPLAYEVWMNYNDSLNLFKGDFTLPKGMNFALIKIGNEDKIDDNKGAFWDVLVFDDKGKPVEGANYRKAMSYMGAMPDYYQRQPNLMKALELLEKEVEDHPGNIEAKIGLIAMQFNLNMITKNEFRNELKNIISESNFNYDEGALTAVTRALRTLNRNSKAEDLEEEFIKRNPESKLAEEKYIERLSQADSFDEFTGMIKTFLEKFPGSLKREMMISYLVDSYLQLGMFNDLTDDLNAIKNVPGSIYSDLARQVALNSSLLPDSSEDARKRVVLDLMNNALEEAKKDKYLLKPKFVSEIEWMNGRESNLAVMHEEFGNLLLFYEDYKEADEHFSKAKELMAEDATKSIYEALVIVNYEMEKYKEAFGYAEEAILNTKDTEKIEKLFPKLFKEVKPKNEDMLNTLEGLKEKAEEKRLERLEKERLDSELTLGYLKTLSGMTIDFGIIRGKVLVLVAWSTWCDPCFQPLVALDMMNNEYADDFEVSFGAVNVWEKSDDAEREIQSIISDNELELPVYIDFKDSLPGKMSISGLPTTLIFGKQGNLQFRIAGFDNEEDYLRKVNDRIKLLKELE